MKKFKSNTLMMLLFGICAIFGMNVVKAEDYFTISSTLTVVCNPQIIKNGEQTKCYIVAIPDPKGSTNEANASMHGFVTKAFVTKDLQIVKAENNTNIANTAVGFTKQQTATGTDKITGEDIPDEVASVRCVADNEWVEDAYNNKHAIKNAKANEFACAMFYTKKSVTTNAYTPSSIKNGSASYKTTVLKDHQEYGVIGNYVVKMPESSTDGGSCGEICILAKGVQKLSDYATWEKEGSKDLVRHDACVEIGRVSENPHPGITPPQTGAFVSYAILVAGALIAIGAVVIAKKNNTFNKI